MIGSESNSLMISLQMVVLREEWQASIYASGLKGVISCNTDIYSLMHNWLLEHNSILLNYRKAFIVSRAHHAEPEINSTGGCQLHRLAEGIGGAEQACIRHSVPKQTGKFI
jgi:hypothetical protein